MAQVIKVMVSVLVPERYANGEPIMPRDIQIAVQNGLDEGIERMACRDDAKDAVVHEMINIDTDFTN